MKYTEEQLRNLRINVDGNINFSKDEFTLDGKPVVTEDELLAVSRALEGHMENASHLTETEVGVIVDEKTQGLAAKVDAVPGQISTAKEETLAAVADGYTTKETHNTDITTLRETDIPSVFTRAQLYTDGEVELLESKLSTDYATKDYVDGAVSALDSLFKELIRETSVEIARVDTDLQAAKETIPVAGEDFYSTDQTNEKIAEAVNTRAARSDLEALDIKVETMKGTIPSRANIVTIADENNAAKLARVAFTGSYNDLSNLPRLEDYATLATVREKCYVLETQLKHTIETGDTTVEATLRNYIDNVKFYTDLASMHFKGVVEALPETASNGDTYTVAGETSVRHADTWVKITPDLTPYQTREKAAEDHEGLDGKITANSEAIAVLGTRVETLETNSATKDELETARAALQTNIETLSSSLTNLGSTVTILQGTVSELEEKVDALPTKEQLTEQYEALKQELHDNYYTKSQVDGKIAALGYGGRITALETTVGNIPETYARKEEVSDILDITGNGFPEKTLTQAIKDIVGAFPFSASEVDILRQMASLLTWQTETVVETETGPKTVHTQIMPDTTMSAVRAQLLSPMQVVEATGPTAECNMRLAWAPEDVRIVYVDAVKVPGTTVQLTVNYTDSKGETHSYVHGGIVGGSMTRLHLYYDKNGTMHNCVEVFPTP